MFPIKFNAIFQIISELCQNYSEPRQVPLENSFDWIIGI